MNENLKFGTTIYIQLTLTFCVDFFRELLVQIRQNFLTHKFFLCLFTKKNWLTIFNFLDFFR